MPTPLPSATRNTLRSRKLPVTITATISTPTKLGKPSVRMAGTAQHASTAHAIPRR